MNSTTSLSSNAFYWSVLAGGKKLIEHQDEINKINVFPVPDGDTGSNLAATASSIIYNTKESTSLQEVALSIGDAALDGARGNSGVIFAQFLYSIGQEMNGIVELTTQKFAQIVNNSSKYVYDAIPNPQEGTIITVIRTWAEFIHDKQSEFLDFETLFTKAEVVAKKALARTSEQLEALKLAKVVDAGAKGFILFIEGMKETILNKAFSRNDHNMDHLLMAEIDTPMAEAQTLTEESLHNRFCTETCIIGNNIDKNEVLAILQQYSDSIVTAGSSQKLRLHFHTNFPALVFDKLRQFGTFSFQKIEDMRRQYTTTHHRKSNIAFVIDSNITLDPEFIDKHQIHLIPILLEINKVNYYDWRSMDLEIFSTRLKEKNANPKSGQPSPKTFADMFKYLANYYDSIVVLSMSQGVSGTYNSALQGKNLANLDCPIDIIDSSQLGAGGGVIAYNLAEDIDNGLSHAEIVKKAQHYIKNTKHFITFRTIDHMIKGGRLGAFKGTIIKLLKLCPVLEIINGKPIVTDKALGFQKALQKTFKALKKESQHKKIKNYTITHTIIKNFDVQNYIDQIQDYIGFAPSSINLAPPSIATHVGFGAICVGVIYEEN